MGVVRSIKSLANPLGRRPAIAGRDLVFARLFIHVEIIAPELEQLTDRTRDQRLARQRRREFAVAKRLAIGRFEVRDSPIASSQFPGQLLLATRDDRCRLAKFVRD